MPRSPNRCHDETYFYKYTSDEVAEIILRDRTLRWSSPLHLNDPFDFGGVLQFGFNRSDLTSTLTEEIAKLIEAGTGPEVVRPAKLKVLLSATSKLSIGERAGIARELRKEEYADDESDPFKELQAAWSEELPGFRVLCFSKRNDITSLWNHYADNYRGVVLEFEAIDEIDSPCLMARPVIYSDSPPQVSDAKTWVQCMLGLGNFTYMDLFKSYQYMKTSDWKSEEEWRIVSGIRPGETGLYQDYPFYSDELTGLYLGHDCPSERKTLLRSLLKNKYGRAKVYQAIVNKGAGKITFEEF